MGINGNVVKVSFQNIFNHTTPTAHKSAKSHYYPFRILLTLKELDKHRALQTCSPLQRKLNATDRQMEKY